MAVTIKDVAKKAGVAVSTVSRVLSNNSRISLATQKKVRAVIEELGYQPNTTARSLSTGKSNQVGVILPLVAADAGGSVDNFILQLINGINSKLRNKGAVITVAIATDWQKLLANVAAMVEQAQINNFIVLYATKGDIVVDYLRRKKQNFVIVGTPKSAMKNKFVDNNNQLAGKKAAEYFWDKFAPKAPVFVQSVETWQYEEQRYLGCLQIAQANNCSIRRWQLNNISSQQDVAHYLAGCDAIICASDAQFLALNQYLQPNSSLKQLPLLSFNASHLYEMIWQGKILQVDLRPTELGQAAVQLLFSQHVNHQLIGFDIV